MTQFHIQEDSQKAEAMLKRGMTVGMIEKKLATAGVPDHTREKVMSLAVSRFNRKAKLRNAGILIAGLVTMAFGFLLSKFTVGIGLFRVPIGVAMVGLILTVLGFHGVLQTKIRYEK